METKIWCGNNDSHINEAAEYLLRGELVAFPTETVYGLGGNALDGEVAKKIYQAKGRPSDNPLIVHIYAREQLSSLVREVSPIAEQLIQAFWPGPLSLIMPRKIGVPDAVTGGLDTVAVRMPNHPAALALLKSSGLPIAAPSANTSGKPSPTTAAHVYHDLAGKIAGIIDGGATEVGLESTVLDITVNPPVILRPGGISQKMIEAVIGPVMADTSLIEETQAPKAPGMKYKHYAPKAAIRMVAGSAEQVADQLRRLIDGGESRFGLMVSQEVYRLLAPNEGLPLRILGYRAQPETLAHELFAALRWFDEQPVDVILTERFTQEDIGAALMNRLDKAAGIMNR